ncbi:uracil-xanthine permease family protein [Clostridium bowmanii]|uniref:uracil-xanthine permease family protein n=1 Tax=Clostridium bowmanii TaxID=132925 RepID=UPI001C0C22C1|nr:uracil-xanthine permease family protein [Clostridium bowmanii]MBU3188890.1 uracil-xanthine permease family protein [Clostridium bowmanii]MCA1073704.1 uracil-xanthine permease family protein [Clostridium bowmanii]
MVNNPNNTNVERKVKFLKTSRKTILAIQHLIAMFGATVLVPILTGLDPSVALIAAGVGTLIFHLCTKGKVPVFLGSSFAFIPVIITVKGMFNGDLTYAQGGIVVAGFIYVIVSIIIKKIGVEKIKNVLPPQVVGPMIILIGLNLIPVAIDMAKVKIWVAVITLGTALLITLKGKGFFKQIAILSGVIVGYLVCLAIGFVDTSIISKAAIVAIPNFTFPKFDMGAILIITPVVLAVFMEHVGDITTNGQVVGKDFIKDPGLNRTLLGDGLATLVAGFIGGPANTTYSENTGVLALTKNYDPSILRLTAIFAIILGFVAKVGGFLMSIPVPVMGGISLMLFTMIALIGVKNMKTNIKVYDAGIITVIAAMLIIGLGTTYLQKYTGINIGIPINENVTISGLSLAAIVGIVLNALLNRKKPLKNN